MVPNIAITRNKILLKGNSIVMIFLMNLYLHYKKDMYVEVFHLRIVRNCVIVTHRNVLFQTNSYFNCLEVSDPKFLFFHRKWNRLKGIFSCDGGRSESALRQILTYGNAFRHKHLINGNTLNKPKGLFLKDVLVIFGRSSGCCSYLYL
jgi:hypothetical protein